jgi:hypothetical protein
MLAWKCGNHQFLVAFFCHDWLNKLGFRKIWIIIILACLWFFWVRELSSMHKVWKKWGRTFGNG